MELDFEVQLVVLYKFCYLYINRFDTTHFFCLKISQNGLTNVQYLLHSTNLDCCELYAKKMKNFLFLYKKLLWWCKYGTRIE